ncbi:MAG TPA: GFA family protein [Candidatus Binataceae bacterium]|nr:GFA family protein [Candidatus Binataceae bacterium]
MTIDPPFVPLTGGCKCGKVRFRMEVAPIITHCCHCRTCQKVSGSAFSINAMIETDRLTILEGAPQPFQGADGQKALLCPDCGFSLWSYHPKFGDAIAFVGVGTLDRGERLPPEAHYFTRSKHPWVVLPSALPTFEELGDPGKPGASARIAAALAARGSGR